MDNERLPAQNPGDPNIQHKSIPQLLHIAEFSRSLGMINLAARELEVRLRRDKDNIELHEAYQYVLWQHTYFESVQRGVSPVEAQELADFRVWDYEIYHPTNPQLEEDEEARIALFKMAQG